MAKVQSNDVVSVSYRGPDRRRGGPVKLQRWTVALVRSRWVAAFVVALAVSYSFHLLETRTDKKIEHQARITNCVISGVDDAQRQPRFIQGGSRVLLRPILEQCQKHYGK